MAFGFTPGLPAADIFIRRTRECTQTPRPGVVVSTLSLNTPGRLQPGWENDGLKSLFEQSGRRRWPPSKNVVRCGLNSSGRERVFTYPLSVTVAALAPVHLSSLWLSFPLLCKAVARGVGTWDDPSEQPCDGKAEFPAEEECRDNAGVTCYWGLSSDTAAALATFALLWGFVVVGQFFPSFFLALMWLFFPTNCMCI